MNNFSAIAWLGSARASTRSAHKNEEDFQLALPQAGQLARAQPYAVTGSGELQGTSRPPVGAAPARVTC